MRTFVKFCLFILGYLLSLPLILLSLLEAGIGGKETERLYSSCTEVLSLIPTLIGTNMRRAFYFATCTDVAWDTNFKLGSWLAHRDNRIGHKVSIGVYTYIGYAVIGEGVLFGARTSVISGKYQHGRPSDRSTDREIVEENEIITIGKNSWIGQDVVIMANIGENCTVGAGSVVMRDVPDNITVMGNPARRISL